MAVAGAAWFIAQHMVLCAPDVPVLRVLGEKSVSGLGGEPFPLLRELGFGFGTRMTRTLRTSADYLQPKFHLPLTQLTAALMS